MKLQACRPAFLPKRRHQHKCLLKKFLRTAFFVEHLTFHYTFSKFYVMIEFFGRLWIQNWHFSYFLCYYLDFLHGPCLFRTCFHTIIFSKCKFLTHYNVGSSTILTESLRFRNNSRIAVSSLSENFEYEIFEYCALSLFLFRSGLGRHGLK